MLTGKPPPRFVPTLTEVVLPGERAVVRVPIDSERIVDEVLQTIRPRLEHQLRAALQSQVDEHMRLASVQWRADIEDTVRSVVARLTTPSQLSSRANSVEPKPQANEKP